MDGDRFDALTRAFRERFSRREIPAVMASLSVFGSLFTPALAKKEHSHPEPDKDTGGGAQRRKKPRKPKPRCRVTQNTTTISLRVGAFGLTRIAREPSEPGSPQVSTTTIRNGKALVLESRQETTTGNVSVVITYGRVFKGIRKATFRVVGTSIEGDIDGRAIVPFAAGSHPRELKFQDGLPAPKAEVDKKTSAAIKTLFKQAKSSRARCSAAGGERNNRVGDSFGCWSCKGSCAAADFTCGTAAGSSCAATLAVPFFGAALYAACLVSAGAACVKVSTSCLNTCRASRECCPVLCGTLPDWSCCEADQQCLTFGTGFGKCCAAGETACHERSCCRPGDNCLPDGSCCPATLTCGSQCCAGLGTICCNGQCCTGECLNGSCCPNTSRRCGNTCCPLNQSCCNGVCCAAGQSCHPQTNTCTVICSPNQTYCAPINQCCNGSCCYRFGSWGCGPGGCVF